MESETQMKSDSLKVKNNPRMKRFWKPLAIAKSSTKNDEIGIKQHLNHDNKQFLDNLIEGNL